MIDRRSALAGITFAAMLGAGSRPASACERIEWEDDRWGEKLISYLRSGDEDSLDGLFRPDCSLVCFEKRYVLNGEKFAYEGEKEVRKAMIGLRAEILRDRTSMSGPRRIDSTALVGPMFDGQMNRITVAASALKPVDTSCGWTTFEEARHIYYQAGLEPGIQFMAVLPPMYERNVR